MAQSTDAAAAEGADNSTPQPKPDSMSIGVGSLVNAISSVFAGIATESLSSDGKLNISQLPVLLERTASMLRDINQAQDQIVDNTQNVAPVTQAEPDKGSSVLSEMSPMKTRVGSDLQPAPMEEITGMEWSWQYFRSSTLLSMLSIASTT